MDFNEDCYTAEELEWFAATDKEHKATEAWRKAVKAGDVEAIKTTWKELEAARKVVNELLPLF